MPMKQFTLPCTITSRTSTCTSVVVVSASIILVLCSGYWLDEFNLNTFIDLANYIDFTNVPCIVMNFVLSVHKKNPSPYLTDRFEPGFLSSFILFTHEGTQLRQIPDPIARYKSLHFLFNAKIKELQTFDE